VLAAEPLNVFKVAASFTEPKGKSAIFSLTASAFLTFHLIYTLYIGFIFVWKYESTRKAVPYLFFEGCLIAEVVI